MYFGTGRKSEGGHLAIHTGFKPFDFQGWIAENEHLLKPPVSNKQLFDTKTDMVVMIVGGPNQRVDFHDDPVEEFFYQLKGDMVLKIAENGKIFDVPIREGEVFLLPRMPDIHRSDQSKGLSVLSLREPVAATIMMVSNGSVFHVETWCIGSKFR